MIFTPAAAGGAQRASKPKWARPCLHVLEDMLFACERRLSLSSFAPSAPMYVMGRGATAGHIASPCRGSRCPPWRGCPGGSSGRAVVRTARAEERRALRLDGARRDPRVPAVPTERAAVRSRLVEDAQPMEPREQSRRDPGRREFTLSLGSSGAPRSSHLPTTVGSAQRSLLYRMRTS